MVETHFDESYSSRLKLQSVGLGVEPPAVKGNCGSGAEPPMLRRFYSFFLLNYAFLV